MIQKTTATLLVATALALVSCRKDLPLEPKPNEPLLLAEPLTFHPMATAALGETSYTFSKQFDVAYASLQQGLGFAGGSHYVSFDVNESLRQARIIQYNSSGVEIKRSGRLNVGHGAEISYRQANGKFYVTDGALGSTTPYVYEVDMQAATPRVTDSIDFSTSFGQVGMVAVDNGNGRLVISGRPGGTLTIAIADFNGKVLSHFAVPSGLGTYSQGIEVIGNEILYYTSFSTTPKRNQITVFSTTGTLLYTINVPIEAEGEGLSVDEATRTVYVGTHKPNQVYKMNPAFVSAALLGMNLLINQNAEGGAAAADPSVVVPVPFWTPSGTTVARYGEGNLPTASSPGSPNRGRNFFRGGRNAGGTFKQQVNVSNLSADVDAGVLKYSLKGWLGGYGAQNDNAKVTATFLNASATPLGTATLGPVLAADRNKVTGMLQRTAAGTVPAGTRSILVTLTMTRTYGSNCDGYADDLSLVLSKP